MKKLFLISIILLIIAFAVFQGEEPIFTILGLILFIVSLVSMIINKVRLSTIYNLNIDVIRNKVIVVLIFKEHL